MRILFGICSWGLGHIMRSLPIIEKLAEENKVFLLAHGRSLSAAKKDLKNNLNIKFIDLPDYPSPYTKNPNFFIPNLCLNIPKIINNIRREHRDVEKLVNKYKINLIISDQRYGVFSKRVASYFITHQLKFIAPFGLTPLTEFFNFLFEKKFRKIFVPDFPDFSSSLSGELSHNLKFFDIKKIIYLGVISPFKKRDIKKDINTFFSISGPEPQRSVFEKIIFSQLKNLEDKKIIVSLGLPEKKFFKEKNNIKLYSYLEKEKREEILNRSKLIVSRSGYSTLMDLAELEKKAFFVPTKNQTEQEYLASFHFKQKNCYFKEQDKIDLKEDLKKASSYKGLKAKWKTKKSLEILLNSIS